jgi:carbon monoxide dehydrogenase subunit G
MELEHEFTVPVPVEQAWPALLDVERIAPCMPGAALDSIDGDEFTGKLKVKLGAMTITYRGSARIVSKDETARTVTIEGSGKEARGSGTATATVEASMHDEGGQTRVTVHTKLNITGRPAQFGRGIMAEVGGKLIGRFADNLAEELGRDPASASGAETGIEENAETPPPGAETAAPGTDTEPGTEAAAVEEDAKPATGEVSQRPAERGRPESAEPIDLLEVAGPSVAKRLVGPLLGGVVVFWTLRRILRAVRRHR